MTDISSDTHPLIVLIENSSGKEIGKIEYPYQSFPKAGDCIDIGWVGRFKVIKRIDNSFFVEILESQILLLGR